MVLRGRYQTLPVALYGWTVALDSSTPKALLVARGIEFSASWQPPAALPPAFAGAACMGSASPRGPELHRAPTLAMHRHTSSTGSGHKHRLLAANTMLCMKARGCMCLCLCRHHCALHGQWSVVLQSAPIPEDAPLQVQTVVVLEPFGDPMRSADRT